MSKFVDFLSTEKKLFASLCSIMQFFWLLKKFLCRQFGHFKGSFSVCVSPCWGWHYKGFQKNPSTMFSLKSISKANYKLRGKYLEPDPVTIPMKFIDKHIIQKDNKTLKHFGFTTFSSTKDSTFQHQLTTTASNINYTYKSLACSKSLIKTIKLCKKFVQS